MSCVCERSRGKWKQQTVMPTSWETSNWVRSFNTLAENVHKVQIHSTQCDDYHEGVHRSIRRRVLPKYLPLCPTKVNWWIIIYRVTYWESVCLYQRQRCVLNNRLLGSVANSLDAPWRRFWCFQVNDYLVFLDSTRIPDFIAHFYYYLPSTTTI